MSCSCLQFNHFHVEHLLSEMARRNSNLHNSILKYSSLKFRKLTKRIQARIKFVLRHLSHSRHTSSRRSYKPKDAACTSTTHIWRRHLLHRSNQAWKTLISTGKWGTKKIKQREVNNCRNRVDREWEGEVVDNEIKQREVKNCINRVDREWGKG